MKSIKKFFIKIKESIKNPIIRNTIIILGIFILIFIIIVCIASCKNKRVYTYKELEAKMVTWSKNRKSSVLPLNNKDVIEIPLQTFVDEGYIKDLKSNISNNSDCDGNVKIINNNGYYLYIPYLDCKEDYKSQTLYNTLINENNIVVTGNGLYEDNGEYIYRGDSVNNYLLLNGIKYRIIKVNKDHTIKVLDTTKRDYSSWDDRYNVDRNTEVGINDYVHNGVDSRIKETIENTYNSKEFFTDDMRSYFISNPICIGKRSINDNIFDSKIECSTTIDAFPFSLLYPYEFYKASLDTNCNKINDESCLNYNYLTSIGTTWTTIADKDSTYKAFKITKNGVNISNASSTSNVKIVTNINAELIVEKGTGSQTDPYIIKTFGSTTI